MIDLLWLLKIKEASWVLIIYTLEWPFHQFTSFPKDHTNANTRLTWRGNAILPDFPRADEDNLNATHLFSLSCGLLRDAGAVSFRFWQKKSAFLSHLEKPLKWNIAVYYDRFEMPMSS